MGDISKEPSMEEILSSIKRIIADDGDFPARREPKSASRREAERESHRKAVVASLAKDADEGIAGSSYVDEVLELTEEMPRVGHAARADEPVAEDADVFELGELVDDTALDFVDTFERVEGVKAVPNEPAPVAAQSAPATAAAAAASSVSAATGGIVSAESAGAARSSLAALSSLIVQPDEAQAGDNTLEGLVRDMLRPMMKDWLDANLPRLVEGMVAKEIARITGRTL